MQGSAAVPLGRTDRRIDCESNSAAYNCYQPASHYVDVSRNARGPEVVNHECSVAREGLAEDSAVSPERIVDLVLIAAG
jgi:hypothetical protein